MDEGRDYYFGFHFVKSLFRIFPLFFTGFDYAFLLTVCIFILGGSYEYMNYHTGIIIGDFYKVLLNHNESGFWKLFAKAVVLYLVQTLLQACQILISCLLAIQFRRTLVTSLHELYFKNRVYYRLAAMDNEGIDNPDQRLTQDAEKLTRILAKNVLPYAIISPGVIVYYTYMTWKNASVYGVGIIYAYFIFGTIVNRFLMSPFTKWTARAERAEGNFRYKHVSVRDHAEEAAFYDAEQFEEFESNRIFNFLLRTVLRLAWWNFPGQFFQCIFDYYGAILSYAIQVIPIFILNSYAGLSPDDLAKQISNNSFFFMYLINSFTRLTDLAIYSGEVAGYSQRISALIEYSHGKEHYRRDTIFNYTSSEKGEGALFITEGLTCSPPLDPAHLIAKDLSTQIPLEKSVLITGSSGIGKTSLLRILKQLWPPSQGHVSRFMSYSDMLFLPQQCYFPVGGLSLRKQLQFPHLHMNYETSSIIEVLKSLSLSRMLTLCGDIDDAVDFEWQDVLSPGEQQRLSIARVLLQKPKVVILDEATSNMSYDMERTIYTLLQKNQICYVSVGHRETLREYHQIELHLQSADKWDLKEIDFSNEIKF